MADDDRLIEILGEIRARGAIGEASLEEAVAHAEQYVAALPEDFEAWEVPYLPIDPAHLGRSYEAVIRVNSQSGKGGVSYILEHEYHLDLPRAMQVEFTNIIQGITDETSEEITSYEIYRAFESRYFTPTSPLELVSHRYSTDTASSEKTELTASVRHFGQVRDVDRKSVV